LTGAKNKNKVSVKVSRLVDGQFRLHYDTEQLRKNMDKIKPTDVISISQKIHGTSWVVGKVLTTRPLKWYEKLISKFVPVNVEKYDTIYASRKVIKNGFINTNSKHFYDYDLWADVKARVEDLIPNGFTLYGEAVGFLPSGKMIQPGYHYGAKPNTFDIYIYRVTFTTTDGKVFELDWTQMSDFCEQRGLNTVKQLYYGHADMVFMNLMHEDEADYAYSESMTDKEKYPPGVIVYRHVSEWRDAFLEQLSERKDFGLGDVMCKDNNYEVPSEGVVIRLDKLNQSVAFKLKNFRFLKWESDQLDKGEQDIETVQSEEVGDETS
jgi:hypothetical protein